MNSSVVTIYMYQFSNYLRMEISSDNQTVKKQLIFVTSNDGKFLGVKNMLLDEFDIIKKPYDGIEPQGTHEEIATYKAKWAANRYNKPVIIDDTSLIINIYNRFPGPYIKELGFNKDTGKYDDDKMCETFWEMISDKEDKSIKATCIFAYCEPGSEPILYEGHLDGIACSPSDGKGPYGFSWDTIFTVPGMKNPLDSNGKDLSLAQISLEEKNKISFRKKALDKLIAGIKKIHSGNA